LDKAAIVLSALEAGPSTLAQLVTATGLARPTAHRLAVALEHHRLVTRDLQGRFILGPRLGELAAAAGEDRLLAAAGPRPGCAARPHQRERPALPAPG
jgi:DNA-binding IclR family transcriptional regulator